MRRMFFLVTLSVAMLVTLGAGPSLVVARSALQGSPLVNIANPEIGDVVSYISESGSEMARLQATEIVLDWTEYSEYYPPSPGTQYIAIVVDVINLGSRGALLVRADDFRVQDIDGFFYTRSWASAAEHATLIPADKEVGVAQNETKSLVLIYQVLSGVELGHLFWQPEYTRLLTVANLDGYTPGR